jgi:hypothetical protein
MGDTNLNITIKLLDQASSGIKGVGDKFRQVGLEMRQVGRELTQVGMTMTMAGTAITAPLALAFKTAGDYSASVHQVIRDMGNDMIKLQVSIGQALLPSMQKVEQEIRKWVDAWNALSPAQKEQIVNTAFMIGQWLLMGGIVLTVMGRIIRSLAAIALLIKNLVIPAIQGIVTGFAELMALNPFAWLIVGIALVVAAMWKWKAVGDTVMGTLQVLVDVFLSVLDTIKIAIEGLLDTITRAWAFQIGILEKLPLSKALKTSLDDARKTLDTWRTTLEKDMGTTVNHIMKNSQEAGDILTGKEAGSFADGFDKIKDVIGDLVTKFQSGKLAINDFLNLIKQIKPVATQAQQSWGTFWDGFKMSLYDATHDLQYFVKLGEDTFKQFSSSISSSFKSFFTDAFHGQLKKAQDYFADFGNKLLDIFADVLSKMVTQWIESKLWSFLGGGLPGAGGGGSADISGGLQGVTGLLGNFGSFHTGGIIRAHNGLSLAGNEVPIIAKTGEGVLNETGMKNLGLSNFNALNKGGSVGGNVYQPVVVFTLFDASDVARHQNMITNVVANAVKTNQSLRGVIKQYV